MKSTTLEEAIALTKKIHFQTQQRRVAQIIRIVQAGN